MPSVKIGIVMTDQDAVQNRGNCFKLLAACFYEPDKELLLEEQVCENLGQLMHQSTLGAAHTGTTMKAGLLSTSQKQLNVDYAALFVGPFELLAAPYGSVYLENNRRVMGDSTIDALRFYQEAGLSVDIKEPPDHIAIELEFMYYLCSREGSAIAAGLRDEAISMRAMQVDFFKKAMGWIPEFCIQIRSGACTSFYKALADCLDSYHAFCSEIYKVDAVR